MSDKHKAVCSSAKPIPKVISFQDPLPEPQRYRPQADRILSGDPVQAATNLFQSAASRFNSGVWEAQRGKWRVVFTESELCHLLAGVIVGHWQVSARFAFALTKPDAQRLERSRGGGDPRLALARCNVRKGSKADTTKSMSYLR